MPSNPTPAQLIAEARIWTAQQPHNVEEDPYATHLVRQLADALTAALQERDEALESAQGNFSKRIIAELRADAAETKRDAALQQAEELQRAVTQGAREIRRLEKRMVELESQEPPV